MSTAPRYGNPTLSFRVAPELLDEIRARGVATGVSDGETARSLLARYFAVLAAELRGVQFSAEEAALICDALNGYWMTDLTGGADLVLRSWWIEIDDHIRLNQADRKWGIADPAVLVAKCRALSPGASAALLDAVARWWHRDWPDGMSTQETLHAVGLVQREADSVAR